MSSLREGPMGKLIARKDEEGDEAEEAQASATEAQAKDPKWSVFASSKEALDELQRLADDRMRGLLGHAITHVQQLQGEVKRLQARIEELEEQAGEARPSQAGGRGRGDAVRRRLSRVSHSSVPTETSCAPHAACLT